MRRKSDGVEVTKDRPRPEQPAKVGHASAAAGADADGRRARVTCPGAAPGRSQALSPGLLLGAQSR